MACNVLQPRAHENLKGSDTMSDISETGTGNSGWTSCWDSREDLRDFVTKIGLKDVSDLYQDRFRVDRKKLEQMLSGDNEAPLPADIFFEQIMADTGTHITWPSKLKIGAKSKKDPHVRIAGRPEDVQAAKERIMTVLDTRCNRVTMKMDVSYTDHSHIIGKGGLSIKRVMEETQCHVHFPDSNRSNPTEKSNQVSIAGDIQGVELARSRVRQKTPVVFGFELPIISKNIEPTNPYIVKIQEQYNVQVMQRTRPKLHATLVLVKGVEWEVKQVKRATLLLVDYMCENLANQIPIQMSMEISPHHHPMVIGKNHANLKEIMRVTGAQIMFPDAQDPNIPSLKKSNVTITGNINNVYAARQLLIGSLPLLLMFDLPECTEGLPIKQEQINDIQSKYDVTINIRMKAKQNTLACIIKGTERSASNIYKARNVILGCDDPPIMADIPSTYQMPKVPPNFSNPEPPPTQLPPQPMSPMVSPLISPTWHFPQPNYNQSSGFVGMMHQPQFLFNNMQHPMGNTPGYHPMGAFSVNSGSYTTSENTHSREASSSLSSMSSPSPLPSPMSSPRNSSPNYHNRALETQSHEKTESCPTMSEIANASASFHHNVMERQDRPSMSSDYEQTRMAGYKAMHSRIKTGYRYPTNAWSGYGLSHTSPGKILTDKGENQEEDIWKTPTPNNKQTFDYNPISTPTNLNSSNYIEHTPTNVVNRLLNSKWPDLTSMLTSLGLEKYIRLFSSHEIDLTTFSSMTDKDLVEIGITAFGARRKMLLGISELNKRTKTFSPAPGAERKSSSSTNSCSPREKW